MAMDIIERVLKSEGGFVNNPNDKGGATNFGITAARLGQWRKLGRAATVDEVRELTEAEAREIYEAWYVIEPRFDRIADAYLQSVVVDCGVLHGTGRAARWLQTALGVAVDGDLGDESLGALDKADPVLVARRVLALRFKRIGEVVSKDKTQVVFLAGWLNRAADLLAEA